MDSDNDPFETNPILCSSETSKIQALCSENAISIPSTCDCFMDQPLWDLDQLNENKYRLNVY